MKQGPRIPPKASALLKQIGRLARERGQRAYAVGGCVRDWVLGIADGSDLDVAVEGDGIALAGAVGESMAGEVETYPSFGTASVQWKRGRPRVDFAGCRKERYARPGAYPSVSPGSLQDDLIRRDFTINAMALSLDPDAFGSMIDPFNGRRDIRLKCLRMLHADSFRDDPSRILRGVRFAERFGFHWERETLRALLQAMGEGALGWLNAGRVAKELNLMMTKEPHPAACLRHLERLMRKQESIK